MTNTRGSGSHSGGSGNFSQDRDKAREAGKKGGQQSHGDSSRSTERDNDSQRGGTGNFANDRDKGSEAGRKGGEHSRGGGTR